MRTLIYSISIFIGRVLLLFVAPFSHKVKLFYQGRKNLIPNIRSALINNTNELFWVHCSSVGEFEQGLPVIELIKKENPTWKVVVTFFSPSGYETVAHTTIDYKFYLPIDTASNARQFIALVQPRIALFIKYEYWYHFLKELKKQGVKTYSVSSIFRSSQTFFKWWGGWNRKMLRQFSYFMVQDQNSLNLLTSIDLNNAELTGDTRFDRVLKIKDDTLRFPEIEEFVVGKKIFIIGSLRPEDDELIFSFINANSNYSFIVAPHDITEKHLGKIEESIQSTERHSKLTKVCNKKVLLIDSVGMLSRLYRYANFAYVGGGFSDGIHNILEPAVYNIPVFFGNKHYKKYKEATDLVGLQAAYPVSNIADLKQKVIKLEDLVNYTTVCTKIENYVNSNIGASKKAVEIIMQQASK